MSTIIRRPISQVFKAQFLYELKVITPPLVMEALVHLVHPDCSAIAEANRGIAIFDACAEQKAVHFINYC
jgi:hypothetical protein